MPMSPPPRDWEPPEDKRHNREPSEATIREMQRGAAATGREFKEGDATRHVRMQAIRLWEQERRLKWHCSVETDTPHGYNWPVDTVIVGDETFSELSVEFPSEELFARIGLAVNFNPTAQPEPVTVATFVPDIWAGKLVEKFYESTVLAVLKEDNG